MEKENYKELFEIEKDRIYNDSEINVMEVLLYFKSKGKVFSYFYNRLLSLINKLETGKYYIKVSGKFDKIIFNFEKEYGYDSSNSYKLFSVDMYNDFRRVKGVKKNYDYLDFLKELAKIKAYQKTYRTCRKFYDTYKMMYEFNDFSRFKFWDYQGKEDKHPVYMEFIDRKYPSPIKEEGQNLNYNFLLKKEYIIPFKNIYEELNISLLNYSKTNKKDFENVFIEENKNPKSEVHFLCDTQVAAYFLRHIEFAFDNLTFTEIESSKIIFSKFKNNFKQVNLSKSLKKFELKLLNLNNDALDSKSEIDNIIFQLKNVKMDSLVNP